MAVSAEKMELKDGFQTEATNLIGVVTAFIWLPLLLVGFAIGFLGFAFILGVQTGYALFDAMLEATQSRHKLKKKRAPVL